MVALQRVQVLTDEADKLKILSEYLTNPNLIEKLSADVKALNSLTEQETNKYIEAKRFLAEYDKKLQELSSREDAVKLAESLQLQADEESKAKRDLAQADIDKRLAELKENELLFDIASNEHKNNIELLAAETIAFQVKKDAFDNQVATKEKFLSEKETELAQESLRLSGIRESLDKRAEKIRLREQAADL